MFSDIHSQLNVYSCKFEITINNQVQQQMIEAPRIMIERQFVSYVEQAVQSGYPIKVRLSRDVPIYDDFEGKWITVENEIVFKNNAYLDMEKQEK